MPSLIGNHFFSLKLHCSDPHVCNEEGSQLLNRTSKVHLPDTVEAADRAHRRVKDSGHDILLIELLP